MTSVSTHRSCHLPVTNIDGAALWNAGKHFTLFEVRSGYNTSEAALGDSVHL